MFYVLIKGFLDDVLVLDIMCFEDEYLIWLELNCKEVFELICIIGGFFEVGVFELVFEEFKKIFIVFE